MSSSELSFPSASVEILGPLSASRESQPSTDLAASSFPFAQFFSLCPSALSLCTLQRGCEAMPMKENRTEQLKHSWEGNPDPPCEGVKSFKAWRLYNLQSREQQLRFPLAAPSGCVPSTCVLQSIFCRRPPPSPSTRSLAPHIHSQLTLSTDDCSSNRCACESSKRCSQASWNPPLRASLKHLCKEEKRVG